MNDRRPMLDRDSRARLGRKLSTDYNLMPDPMLPDRLKDLVARLLDGPGPAGSREVNVWRGADGVRSPMARMAEAGNAYRSPKSIPHHRWDAKTWA